MSALESARERWGAADSLPSGPLAAELIARALHPSRRRTGLGVVVEGVVAEPPPGWLRCPECARRVDRDGARLSRVWCTGDGRTRRHALVEMEPQS